MLLARKILNNFLILFSSQIIVRILNFAIVIYLARVVTPSEFGLVNFAKTMALYFGLILNIGLDQLGLRELAKDRMDRNNLVGHILLIKLALAVFAYAALSIFLFLSRLDKDIKIISLLYGLVIIAESLSLVWAFNALEKMKSILYSEAASTGLLFILVIIFVKGSSGVFKIPIFEAAAVLAGSFILISNFYLLRKRISFVVTLRGMKGLVRRALPLGGASAMSYAYYSFGVMLLGFISGMRDVGIFIAPYKLVIALTQVILGVLSMAVIPTIAKLCMESKEGLKDFLLKLSRALLFSSFFIFVLCTLLAEPIIQVIYGVRYSGSVVIFRILLWWLVAIYMSFHLTLTLYASDRTKEFFKVSLYTLLINIILNIILIPRFGIAGLAVAITISGASSIPIALRYVNKNVVKLPIMKPEFIFSLGSIGISFALLPLSFSIVYKVVSATILYLVLSFFTKILRWEDLIFVKSIILRTKPNRGGAEI